MRRLNTCASALFLLFAASLSGMAEEPSKGWAAGSSDSGWTRLFDGKSLQGWYAKIQNQKVGEDPGKVFQVHDGVIHVYKDQAEGSAAPSGYIATDRVYANYHLRMEFKWGTKKFKPRVEARRDAGLLYHVTRPDLVWPRCVECQIQEGDVGDCFTVRGVQLVSSIKVVPIQTPGGVKQLPRYKGEADGGKSQVLGDRENVRRIVKASTHEHEGWNTVEIIVRGGQGSEHIVNGKTVFRAKELMQWGPQPLATPLKKGEVDKREWEPLTRGRIALQCEFAEVFYRNVEIRELERTEGKK